MCVKIGQVTYCGNNYGSVLQCLATQLELKKHDLDCVLFIREETGVGRLLQSLEFRFNALWKLLIYSKYRHAYQECLKALQPPAGDDGLQKNAIIAIDLFVRENIKQERFSWGEMKKIARSCEYAFFLSGSDQIWSAQWFVTNRLWFLRFCPRQKRVAWMPSFGADQLPEYNRPEYRRFIRDYENLSVREEAGANIIKDLLGITVPVLADPVFLLSSDEWRAIASDNMQADPYILMFFLDRPSQIALKQVHLLQKNMGVKVIYFSYYYHECKGEFLSGGPDVFLSLVEQAKVVLTDSFHACVFSSIFGTPFYAFSRSSNNGAKQMIRIQNLLSTLSMPERYIASENECCNTIEPIPQELVQKEIESLRNCMQDYLNEVLLHQLGGEA
jgi:hypothetical protein